MDNPLKISIEVLSVGDMEIDCMALLTEVMKGHGGALNGETKERITTWLANRYKLLGPSRPNPQ